MIFAVLTMLATAVASAFLLVGLETRFQFFKSELVKAAYCLIAAVIAMTLATVVAVWQGAV